MSDPNLLLFGCIVSFIAVAGFYVYLRHAFTAQQAEAPQPRPEASLRDVA